MMSKTKPKGGKLLLSNNKDFCYQWDTGLSITGVTADSVCRMANENSPVSIRVEEEDGSFAIPNILLTSGRSIIVYNITVDGDNETVSSTSIIRVVPAPKPADYIYTEAEIKKWEQLESEINELRSDVEEDIGDLEDAIDEKADAVHTHTILQITDLQTVLNGKANVSHTHTKSQVTGLQDELDGKANASHTHTKSQITDMPTTMPSPGTLTFTGGATGTYDGSTDLTIDIPEGGGGSSVLIVTATQASSRRYTTDKSFADITTAHNSGTLVFLKVTTNTIPLVDITENSIQFASWIDDTQPQMLIANMSPDNPNAIAISVTNIVLSVNDNEPDSNGNVTVETGGGVTDYNDLENQPSINGVGLSGNKTYADLSLAPAVHGHTAGQVSYSDSNYYTSGTVGKAISDLNSNKVSVAQGSAHAGEFLVVGSDGNVKTLALETWQGGSY